MKTTLVACSCFAFATLALAAEPKAAHAILIRDGHANALYALGEEAVFTLSVSGRVDRAFSSNGLVKVTMDRFGGKPILKRIWDPEKEPVLTLKGKLDEPGFLRVTAVTKPVNTWGIGEGNGCWSVGYEPTRIVGATPYPADFADYWHGELDRLAREVPVDFRMEREAGRSKGTHDVFLVSVATFGGERIWGHFIAPKQRSKPRLPLVIRIAGAGPAYCGADAENFKKPDELALIMNVHRYRPADGRKAQADLYDALNADCAKRYGADFNYCVSGAGVSREKFYFHNAVVGLVRLAGEIIRRPEVDGDRVWYTGGSQGSGMGLALTALTPQISRAFYRVPAMADLCGFRFGHQSGWPLLIERHGERDKAMAERVAPYYDAVNFAHLVKVPARIVVGFADNCCPPYGGYAAFNAMPSPDKAIANGIGMWHVTRPEFERRYEAWLRGQGEGLTAGCENVDPARRCRPVRRQAALGSP